MENTIVVALDNLSTGLWFGALDKGFNDSDESIETYIYCGKSMSYEESGLDYTMILMMQDLVNEYEKSFDVFGYNYENVFRLDEQIKAMAIKIYLTGKYKNVYWFSEKLSRFLKVVF